LRFILLFSPRWLFLYPGLALFAGGLLVMLWLLPGPRSLFGLGLDVHTLLFAAVAILVGAQAVGFHILSKVFTINEGLMPADPRLMGLARFFPLEVALLVAGLLTLLGIVGAVGSVAIWERASFGSLDPVATLRPVIASATALTSFFGSVLGLKVTPKLDPAESDPS
jgi:hypothetical protein